jgi:hypothetical protein
MKHHKLYIFSRVRIRVTVFMLTHLPEAEARESKTGFGQVKIMKAFCLNK